MKTLGLPTVAAPKGRHPAVVYFFEASGMVKIGSTRSLDVRVRAMEAFCPADCRLVGFGPGSVTREKHLHQLLEASHSHSEWFRPSIWLRRIVLSAIRNDAAWQSLPSNSVAEQRVRYGAALKAKRQADRELTAEEGGKRK